MDDVETALTAELGKELHRQTIQRVWEKLLKSRIVTKYSHGEISKSKVAGKTWLL